MTHGSSERFEVFSDSALSGLKRLPLLASGGLYVKEHHVKAKKPGRAQRVGDQIARDLAKLIPLEVRDPRVGLVTITGCEVTPDYAHAKVYFTVLGSDPAESVAGLNAAAGMLRNRLFRELRIHTVPTLHFAHDTSVAKGFEMDALIKKAMAVTGPAESDESDDSAASTGKVD